MDNKQHNIKIRHYGYIIQSALEALCQEEELNLEDLRAVANQMKRNLALYNQDALSDSRVYSDIYALTNGKIDVSDLDLISDYQALTDVFDAKMAKKKKK